MSLGMPLKGWGSVVTSRYSHLIAYAVLILSSLALLPDLEADVQGDVQLYQNISQDLLAGKLPYRDRSLEYPPYVIPIILVPRAFENASISYSMAFKYQVLIADVLLKLLLFGIGLQQPNKLRAFLPLLSYCFTVPFLHFFFLQRYDVWPALICIVGIWLFCSGRYALSGVFFAAGVGVKVYPIVFLPPLFLIAAHRGKVRQFFGGIAGGLMPIVLLSFALPWWRFAAFQGARGLQCESLCASMIWFAKRMGLAQSKWVFTKAWFEVQGTLADAVLPWARLLFAAGVIFSVGWATWVAASCEKLSIGSLSRLLLIPLLGFVAFNQVLSPQFMVWILPIAALGLLEGSVAPMILLVLATTVTHVIFPSFHGDYSNGLNLPETTVLVLRNLTLVVSWALLLRETFPIIRCSDWNPLMEIRKSVLTLFSQQHKPNNLA
jgi:hypothetical protein